MEEENINTPAIEQAPKKRGRKPKAEIPVAEDSAPKKRGRPRKAEENTGEQANISENTETTERKNSLDDVLDSAVKQRRSKGRTSAKTPRQDGPAWRDAPVVSQETESEQNSDNESESEIFVHHNKSDDFEYTKTADDEPDFQNDSDNDADDVPTSFSTTDDDLDPDSYRNQFDDDSDDDDDRRIAEAREYENAVDDDNETEVTQEQARQNNDRNQRWQKRDKQNNRFDKRDRQNNNRNQQNNNRQQQNNRFDKRDRQNNNQRNQNNQQNNQRNQQNNNRQNQNQQKQQQRQNQQKKLRWNQNPNSEEESINPADLPEWISFKNEVALNERLAQIFFGKTPSWELETFEAATPIALDGKPLEQIEETQQAQCAEETAVAQEENLAENVAEEVAQQEVPVEEKTESVEENPQDAIPQKAIADMNYWELMANANSSAVKKFGLEKGLIEKEKPAEQVVESADVKPETEEEKIDFQEPATLSIADCGEIEALADFNEIYKLSAREIQAKYDELGITYRKGTAKSDLVLEYFKFALSQKKLVKVSGVLDVFQDNLGGAITFENDNYRLKKNSVYIPQLFIDKYALKRGHTITAFAMPPREHGRETCPFAVAIASVMNTAPECAKNTTPFNDLVPYYPTRRIILESIMASKSDSLPMRAVDLLTPIGFGQRALIVAPPRTGKTVLMQGIAKSIRMNAPDAHLIILLVDERPEEVTDFKRNVDAEVVASTFDEEATNHVHAAEMVISRARRMVEDGKDVVILLDSITRLARAYNALMPNGGRTMSGGVEANALQKPKKFFGSARNIENGGSLTIIGTALIETGSKMDEVIFEEFKGTGNLELHLDRALSDKRIFPAINIEKSGTRKEELLYHPDEMTKIYSLRRAMKGVPATDAMEMLVQRLKKTHSNIEFLLGLNR